MLPIMFDHTQRGEPFMSDHQVRTPLRRSTEKLPDSSFLHSPLPLAVDGNAKAIV